MVTLHFLLLPIHFKCDFSNFKLSMSIAELFVMMFVYIFYANGACDLNLYFECHNKRCLLKEFVCDGDMNCMRGEDEFNCNSPTPVDTPSQTNTTVPYPEATSKLPSSSTIRATNAIAKTSVYPCHPTPTYTYKLAIVHDNGSTLAISTGESVNFTLANTGCDFASVYSCRVIFNEMKYLQHKSCIPKSLRLSVNGIHYVDKTVITAEKGSSLDIQCSTTLEPSVENAPTDNSAPLQCEGDATENCWVTGSEMRVAVQVLNCSSCEQNSCQVKGQSSCLHLVKNETSFQDAKTQCAQLGGFVADHSVYVDQDVCVQSNDNLS
ncbi:uncharacterized protein LOC131949103 [Physella acuta]|uniref:uncharacterized protein LOC131949103 n=1 Tax=Physella acuta TaxID=109671 RepID=UPI0027DC2363|nr:uncharacterized protein LOC131949103 [Physella acuta]